MFKFTILNHLIQKSSKILKYKANLFTILHCLKEQLVVPFFFFKKRFQDLGIFNFVQNPYNRTRILTKDRDKLVNTLSKEKEIKTAGFKKKHVTQRSFVKLGNTRGSYIYMYKTNSSNSIRKLIFV